MWVYACVCVCVQFSGVCKRKKRENENLTKKALLYFFLEKVTIGELFTIGWELLLVYKSTWPDK